METIDNIIYFDNDDEFFDYAVVPSLVSIPFTDKNGNEHWYSDYDFTKDYYNAIDNGVSFIIKDENSQIYKHKGVSFKTIFKDVQNLEPYYSWEYEND